jgi:dihydrofolate reductase
MRKLLVAEFMSLDGVIQAPGGPDEDPSGEFRFGGWQVPYNDEAIGRAVLDLFSQPFELLLGRRTYDIWAAYWPRIGADSPSHPIAGPFNRVRKHVATHRPDTLGARCSDLARLKGALSRIHPAPFLALAFMPGRIGDPLRVWCGPGPVTWTKD